MPQLDISTFFSQVFWLFLSFALLFFLLSKVYLPKIEKIYEKREANLDNNLNAAKKAREEALILKNNYQILLEESVKKREETINKVNSDIAKMIQQATLEQDKVLAKTLKDANERLKEFEIGMSDQITQLAKEAALDIAKTLGTETFDQEKLKQVIDQNFTEEKYVI